MDGDAGPVTLDGGAGGGAGADGAVTTGAGAGFGAGVGAGAGTTTGIATACVAFSSSASINTPSASCSKRSSSAVVAGDVSGLLSCIQPSGDEGKPATEAASGAVERVGVAVELIVTNVCEGCGWPVCMRMLIMNETRVDTDLILFIKKHNLQSFKRIKSTRTQTGYAHPFQRVLSPLPLTPRCCSPPRPSGSRPARTASAGSRPSPAGTGPCPPPPSSGTRP